MPRKKKSAPPPITAAGWVSVLTATLFALAICAAIVFAFLPVEKASTLGGRIHNIGAALALQMQASDYRGFWIPLLILVFVVVVATGAASRARARGATSFGRAVGYGFVDAVIGMFFQTLELLTSGGGSSQSRSSSSSGGGMSAGGGSFGGGGASGGW